MLITSLFRVKKQLNKKHFHENGQLIFIESGIINVRTDDGSWVVPEGRLAWIPKGMPHSSKALSKIKGWSIITNDRYEKKLPEKICIIKASELLLALLDRLVNPEREEDEFFLKVNELILSELNYTATEELGVPFPISPELLKVAELVLENLNSPNRIEDWAEVAGVSKRTFTRNFHSETGVSFGQWKKQAINLKAIELLTQGKQVSDIALELGYESVSAFIYMFKKNMGDTPMKLLKKREEKSYVGAKE